MDQKVRAVLVSGFLVPHGGIAHGPIQLINCEWPVAAQKFADFDQWIWSALLFGNPRLKLEGQASQAGGLEMFGQALSQPGWKLRLSRACFAVGDLSDDDLDDGVDEASAVDLVGHGKLITPAIGVMH